MDVTYTVTTYTYETLLQSNFNAVQILQKYIKHRNVYLIGSLYCNFLFDWIIQ